jgi:hypothetical protein
MPTPSTTTIPSPTSFQELIELNSSWVGAVIMYNLFNEAGAKFKCTSCSQLHHDGWAIDTGGKTCSSTLLRYTQLKARAHTFSSLNIPATCASTYSCKSFLLAVRSGLLDTKEDSITVMTRYPSEYNEPDHEVVIHVGDLLERVTRSKSRGPLHAPSSHPTPPSLLTSSPSQQPDPTHLPRGILQRVLTASNSQPL